MKTTKDYPATHSMSTAWFIADADGNVGAFDFNANGPVPAGAVTDTCIEELMISYFAYPDEDGFPTFEMTEEQLGVIISSLKPISDEFDSMDFAVRIDTTKEADFRRFVEKEQVVCLSRQLGIYYISLFLLEEDDTIITLFLYALEYVEFDIVNHDNWDERRKEFVYTHYPDNFLPFYLYQQPYSNEFTMKRTIVPLHPFQETQLPQNVRNKLLHLPIKFNDYPDLQIAEFLFCRVMNGTLEYSMIGNANYCQLPKSNGEITFFCTHTLSLNTKMIPLTCRRCKNNCHYLWKIHPKREIECCQLLNYEAYSFNPTVIVITDRDDSLHKMVELDYSNYILVLPLIPVSPKKITYDDTLFSVLSDEMIEKQFKKCRKMFELQLNYYFPYALVFNEQIKLLMAKHYEITDSEITIAQKTYRYFLLENTEADKQEIIKLAKKPYRGQETPYSLSIKEMAALKQKEIEAKE